MSSAKRYTPHYTVKDYQLWEGDWELWAGTAVAMTPSPFGRHGSLLVAICTALKNAIDAARCDATVLAEIDWIISDDTVIRPDASVVCGPPPERHIRTAPAIVVEVLSDATRDRDLTQKRDLYEQNQVEWYFVADPVQNSLQIFRLVNGSYKQVELGETLTIHLCEKCHIDIKLQTIR